MSALATILKRLIRIAPWRLARGALLSVLVLLMGAGLLGLSGWFITATGLAGIAGIGIAFDVFRPSAGVRLLALGRAGARYGERLLTHDATLKALSVLRVDLLRQLAGRDGRTLMGLRGARALNRITADVDALDGLLLRLVLPGAAALVTLGLVTLGLGLGLGWSVAWAVLTGLVPLGLVAFWRLGRAGSDRAETALQDLRRASIDMIRDRTALIAFGTLRARLDDLGEQDRAARTAARALDRAERDAGLLLSLAAALACALAMIAGAALVAQGRIGPAQGAIALFVALALAETILPLRRGVADFRRIKAAAGRIVAPGVSNKQTRAPGFVPAPDVPVALRLSGPALTLKLQAGQAAALTGPSGAGKTTLLLQIAGLDATGATRIALDGQAPRDWDETALRRTLTMVPQRPQLISGTIRDNLTLAGDAPDPDLWAALRAVALDQTIAARGGLDTRLGEGGAGLSGGQIRRLALARAVLKRPAILLLDEPTEGLDDATAHRVLSGLGDALPDTAILAALHRGGDHPIFTHRIALAR